ncbi:MAG TPA: SAM-dependent methyltransferase [Herpetosiphonaceae bacterium]
MADGSLVIVGTGIMFASQLTLEARARIEQAEQVFFLVSEPASAAWIAELNPRAESLGPFYVPGRRRLDIYQAMADHLLAPVRAGAAVCAVFYGHPGVLVTPAHQALRQARAEGLRARMLPAVSAEDCLFADLEVDPAFHGCQSFDATDFLLRRRRFDPRSNLILWQIGVTGELHLGRNPAGAGLAVLAEALLAAYPADHEAVVYEAAQYPGFPPLIQRVALGELAATPVTTLSTLYVPPREAAPFDPAMLDRFGLEWADVVLAEREG